MGVGYQASALHRISTLVIDEGAPYTTEPSANWPFPPSEGARYIHVQWDETSESAKCVVDRVVLGKLRLS